MPTLKQINCSVELGPGNTKVKEYGARYSDGHVETFIAVPDTDIPFSLHMTSEGYIAPGLAYFVFMDGEYQCNRNRVGLKLPGGGVQARDYETEFRLRQKEEKTSFDTFVVRDWTFAKLNRMAADKAPSLNPQFTNNVGTIEVVVLRCRTNWDDNPPPKASRAKISHDGKSGGGGKRSTAAAPAASVKSAAQESEIGGLFGLFDGAFDDMNLEGAADELPVGSNGRVKPNAPPGMAWDHMFGGWIPASCLISPKQVDLGRNVDPPEEPKPPKNKGEEIMAKFKAAQEDIQAELEVNHEAHLRAQLDGHGSQPGVVINQWGARRRDDMRVDKYLGLEGKGRGAYQQYIRETGQSVSSLDRRQPRNNPPFDSAPFHVWPQEAAQQRAPLGPYMQDLPPNGPPNVPPNSILLRPSPQQVAQDLEGMRKRNLDYQQKHPERNQDQAQLELAVITHLERLLREGQGSFAKFPIWLTEVLTDMETRRRYALRLQQQHPQMDLSDLFRDLERERLQALLDPLYQKTFRKADLDDCLTAYYMFYERVEIFERFLQEAEKFSQTSTDEVRARMDYVCRQRDEADEMVKAVEREAPGYKFRPLGESQQGVHASGDRARNYDGGPHGQHRREQPATQVGKNGGMQQVGEGIWKPNQHRAQKQHLPTTSPGFGGGDKANGWETDNKHDRPTQQAPNHGDGQQYNAWLVDENPPSRNGNARSTGWGNRSNQTGGSNGRNKSNSHRTPEHDFNDQNDQSVKGWGDSPSKSSQHQSTKDNTSKNNNVDQNQTDNSKDWERAGGSHHADRNDWTGDAHQKSTSRSVQTAVKVRNEDPTKYIKDYWTAWNRPFSREQSSETNTKKHSEPREVFNYPAAALPAVPDKEAKDASHGIQAGRGADYSHMCRRPTYIDTMEHPYAVFSFKYRSKEALEKILKLKIDEMDLKGIQKQVEQDRLLTMPKHKLIEELMNKRALQKSTSKTSVANGGGKAASGWGNERGGNSGTKDDWGASNSNNDASNDKYNEGSKKASRRGSGRNGNHGGQSKNSNASHRKTSNQSSHSSGCGRNNGTVGQNGAEGANGAAPNSRDDKNGWDNGPANNSQWGWDGQNEPRDLPWADEKAKTGVQSHWSGRYIRQDANQIKFPTPDSIGMKLPTVIQRQK